MIGHRAHWKDRQYSCGNHTFNTIPSKGTLSKAEQSDHGVHDTSTLEDIHAKLGELQGLKICSPSPIMHRVEIKGETYVLAATRSINDYRDDDTRRLTVWTVRLRDKARTIPLTVF
jgi:hypothetical protein